MVELFEQNIRSHERQSSKGNKLKWENNGIYMNKLLTIDAFFLNEDRHTHNIAVLMNGKGDYVYCPIFDNGAGLLADTTILRKKT